MCAGMKRNKSLEEVYNDTGGMGAYQCVMFLLLGFFCVTSTDSVNVNFVAGRQDHWCHVQHLQNLSHDHQKYVAIPQDSDGDYDSCSVYDFPYNQYSLEDFISWNRSEMLQNASTKFCNEWVYDKTLYVNTVTSRFNLVCGDSWIVPFISTVYLLGYFVGALFSGFLSDRYGRKPVLYGGVIIKIVGGLMGTFPVNAAFTLVARFFMGVGRHTSYLAGFVLLMEVLTVKWRTAYGVIYQVFGAIGFMMWPVLAIFIRDDMWLQLVVSVPLIIFLTIWWLIDESPRWLLQQRRYDEAEKVLRKIAACNHCPLPDDFDVRSIDVEKKEGDSRSCLALLQSPTMRTRTVIIDFCWFSVSMMYFALSLNTGTLSGDIFINTILSGAVEIPANILAVVLLAWPVTGRKYTCAGSLLISGVASYISVYMILEDIGIAHTIFATVAKGFVSVAFSAIYIYSSEIFPTEVRNAGIGTASVCARISGMAAPFVGSSLGDIWAPLPSVIYGSFAVVSGLLSFFLPETLGEPMFKTIEEAEAYEKNKKKTSKKLEGGNQEKDFAPAYVQDGFENTHL